MRIPQYIESDTHFVKLQQLLANAINEDTQYIESIPHFVKLQQLLAFAKNEDT